MAKMTGARALTETLVAEGVEIVFGNPGTTELALMRAIGAESRLRYILVLQEAVALGMADGYGRATSKVPFVNLHTVSGLGNAMSLLYNLNYGNSPLVLTAGNQDSRVALQEPWLSGDLVNVARPLTKWAVEVHHPADIPRVMHRAFTLASQPPQGPVFVSLPQDVLVLEDDIHLRPATRVYVGLRPDVRALESAAIAVAEAHAPLVLVGHGVDRVGAHEEVVALVERLGAPVYSTWLTGLQFPTDHPLWGGMLDLWSEPGRQTLRGIDLVISLGSEVFQHMAYSDQPLLAEGVQVVHLDENPWQLGKNEPTIGLQGDLRASLSELLPRIDERLDAAARAGNAERHTRTAAMLAEARVTRRARLRGDWDSRPLTLGRLMAELSTTLPADAILIDDAISASGILRELVPVNQPGRYYNTRGGGSLGWGVGAALGVALARPDHTVVAVVGDGTALMVIQGLWSAAELRLPVKLVIVNNGSYRILKVNALKLFGDGGHEPMAGMDFSQPRIDFVSLAEGFGVSARRVENPSALRGALQELFSMPGPALLDVGVDPSV